MRCLSRTGFVLIGGEKCIRGFLFWGASKDKNIENMWSIWCKLLSCPRGYNKAEAAYERSKLDIPKLVLYLYSGRAIIYSMICVCDSCTLLSSSYDFRCWLLYPNHLRLVAVSHFVIWRIPILLILISSASDCQLLHYILLLKYQYLVYRFYPDSLIWKPL